MKKKHLLSAFVFVLLISISSFTTYKSTSFLSNQTLGDSIKYPVSDLYLLKDINNQPLLVQLTKFDNKNGETNKNIQVHFYPSFTKATTSTLFAQGFVFKLRENAMTSKYGVLADSVEMIKADSLAEIKRFGGILYKNGNTSKQVKSYKGIIQPRFLKLYSADWNGFKMNSKTEIAEGSIKAKDKLYQKEEFVFKKSKSTLKLIILEDRKKENYVLKLAFEGEDKFNANPNVYIQLMGYAGELSIPLGTFVSDAFNPNLLYLPIEKELIEKLLAGKANYSLKFQNPVEHQFSEIRLNQF